MSRFIPSWGQGYIECSYDELVNTFGEPNEQTDGYKTDVEWCLPLTKDGRQTVTIYNWKNGQNYMGPSAPHFKDIQRWNIGGQSQLAVMFVYGMLAKGEPTPGAYM